MWILTVFSLIISTVGKGKLVMKPLYAVLPSSSSGVLALEETDTNAIVRAVSQAAGHPESGEE
ncbi:MAG: hypothetical protein NVS4B11_28560 [Ktedonobacteraceae bacterium]